MKKFNEFQITIEPFTPDIISGMFWVLEPDGIVEEENKIKVYFSENKDIKQEDVENLVNNMVKEGLLKTYSIEVNVIEDRNWNEEWESKINVIKVTDTIVIKPTFREYEAQPGEIVLIIDPKMSFGTGEHQTTKLMLNMIEKYTRYNDCVLDVGTGTGVLAIAAVKLGARNAYAIDNDDWCFENILENCTNNGVADKIKVDICEIGTIEDIKYDLILANIQKNVLMDLCEDFNVKIKNDGYLILSGLLFSDEKDIVEKYRQYNFKVAEKMQMDEWITLVMKRS